jgi:AcrR family transcriptional regulator
MAPKRLLQDDDSPKRQAILDAALELFAERGYHGTTVPDVAERAAVGTGTLYRYFEHKEALVNAVYQRWKGEYGRFLMSDLPVGMPTLIVFQAIWRRMGDFARRHPSVVGFLELHHHRSYLDAESEALERAILEPVLAFVENAQREGTLKAGSPRVLMAVVYGAFIGLVNAEQHGHLKLDEATLDEAERCVWEAIRA